MTDPYQELGNAVVLQAAKDYRDACKVLKRNPKNDAALQMKAEVECFMKSSYFSIFTSLDGKMLLSKLEEEVQQ